MNFYTKHILPKFLNMAMKDKAMEKHRPHVVGDVLGIVLEIGFGSGHNLPFYKNPTKLYALEPSQELYALANERIALVTFPVEYISASAEHIPLQDNSIDVVVSTWTLCSIPHPEIALKEVRRVLRSNGTFVFVDHGRSPRKFFAQLQTFFTPLSKLCAGGCHLDRPIDALISDAGFEFRTLEKIVERSRPLAFLYRGVATVRK